MRSKGGMVMRQLGAYYERSVSSLGSWVAREDNVFYHRRWAVSVRIGYL